jgi:hypothetical protein
MRRIHLRWSTRPDDTGLQPDRGDLVLVFAPAAAPRDTAAEVIYADELLDWHDRAGIEVRVGELLAALRESMGDDDALEGAEYELRLEWVNVLSAHAAASRLADEGPFAELLPSARAPAAIVAGVGAALGIAPAAPPRWRLELPPRGGVGVRGGAARLIVAARAAISARKDIRILTVPGQRLTMALSHLSPGQAR